MITPEITESIQIIENNFPKDTTNVSPNDLDNLDIWIEILNKGLKANILSIKDIPYKCQKDFKDCVRRSLKRWKESNDNEIFLIQLILLAKCILAPIK